jgi:hypothetical protein
MVVIYQAVQLIHENLMPSLARLSKMPALTDICVSCKGRNSYLRRPTRRTIASEAKAVARNWLTVAIFTNRSYPNLYPNVVFEVLKKRQESHGSTKHWQFASTWAGSEGCSVRAFPDVQDSVRIASI